jgi:hypothetical protein
MFGVDWGAMGVFLLAHSMVSLVVTWRVLGRVGYSRWLTLLLLVPYLNLVAVLLFAWADWPVLRRLRDLEEAARRGIPVSSLPPKTGW